MFHARTALAAVAALTLAVPATSQSLFSPSFLGGSLGDFGADQLVHEDMDGDGLADLVITPRFPVETLLIKNLGGGIFAAPRVVPGAGGSKVGDVTGDGAPDLVWVEGSPLGYRVVLAANRGNGTFRVPVTLVEGSPSFEELHFSRLKDVDGDGDLDLLSEPFLFSPLRALNLGGNAFGPFEPLTANIFAQQPYEFSEVDGDGIQDMIVCSGVWIEWSPGLGNGTFGLPNRIETLRVAAARFLLADLDEDGFEDIVLIEEDLAQGTSSLRWIRSLGGGVYAPAADLAAGPLTTPYTPVALRDFDRDGDLDLLARSALELHFVENLGGTTFAAAVPAPLHLLPFGMPSIFDLEGDGDLDVVTLGIDVNLPTNLVLVASVNGLFGEVGTTYCVDASLPNSTGQRGQIEAQGSLDVTQNQVRLIATQLPVDAFGFFLVGTERDFLPVVPNSRGAFCLGGSIGRYVGPGQIGQANANGSISLQLDLSGIPVPNGPPAAVQPGETLTFQAWHRDPQVISTARSNFTSAVELTFP